MNMFAPEDRNGPPFAEYPAPEPATSMIDQGPRPRPSRRPIVVGAIVLALLAVAGVGVALLVGGRDTPPAPVSGAASGAAPPAVAPAPGVAKQAGGKRAGATGLVVGTVVTNAGGTLVVAPDGGGPNATIRTDAGTRVVGDGARNPADLPPGARAVVRVSGTGDALTAVSVASPRGRLTGTVTALDGDVATVVQGNGLSAAVNLAAVTPKPAVGDLITVTGTPNGTTVTADRVRVLPKVS